METHGDFSFQNITRMTYLENLNEIVLLDTWKKSLIKYDVDGKFKQKFKLKQYLNSPFAICSNSKNEIFVADTKRVHVFDNNLNRVRRLDIKYHFSTEIAFDDETENLYIAHENEVSVWNKNGALIGKFCVEMPNNIRVNSTYVFVLNNINENSVNEKRKLKNCIYLFEKSNSSLVRTIKIDDWIDPKGLYIDRNSYIITTAFGIVNKNELSNSRYFYVFDFEGNCILKKESNLSLLVDFIIIKRTNIFAIEADSRLTKNSKLRSKSSSTIHTSHH